MTRVLDVDAHNRTALIQVEHDAGPDFLGIRAGLTFCRMVVDAHQGRIGVESAVGQGSTFWFALPPVQET